MSSKILNILWFHDSLSSYFYITCIYIFKLITQLIYRHIFLHDPYLHPYIDSFVAFIHFYGKLQASYHFCMSDFRILRLSAIHLVILHGFFSEFVIVFHLSKSYNIIGTILGYGYDVLSYEYISNLFLLNLIGIYDILMNFVNELLASAVNCQCLNQTFLDGRIRIHLLSFTV